VDPSPSFTQAELELMFGLRQDVQVHCVPRQTDLPPGALAGVECDLGDGLAARVGAFRFATQRDAFQAYAARLTTYRVPLRSGDCWAGAPGDSSWIPGDGPGEGGDSVNRSGCYLDENGLANIRLTCPLVSSVAESGTYVGVLGTNADIAALFDWTWRYPEGVPMETPSPPGICYNDSIPFPDS
jgi:hypothetical protein